MLGVVVTTFNDPVRLRLCLYGLSRQTLSREQFQVCVVSDGGEQDPDRAVLREAAEWGLDVRYAWLGDKRPGQFRAGQCRNMWLQHFAPHQVPRTLFLDGDCVPETDVLEQHATYAAKPIVVVGARRHIAESVVPQLTLETVPELASLVCAEDARYRLQGLVYQPVRDQLARGVRKIPLQSHRLIWSFQLSVPTRETQDIGGFNIAFDGYGGEDQELGGRLRQVGCSLLGRFDLICYHLDHPRRTGDWKRKVAESLLQVSPIRNGGPLYDEADGGGA